MKKEIERLSIEKMMNQISLLLDGKMITMSSLK